MLNAPSASQPRAQPKAQPKALCLLRSGRRIEVALLDVSTGGCMVESHGWAAKQGEPLSIKLPGLGYQSASVIWTEDWRTGIGFDHHLYEPTLEHLRKSFDWPASA